MKSPVADDTPVPTVEQERPGVTPCNTALPDPVPGSSFSLVSPTAAGYTHNHSGKLQYTATKQDYHQLLISTALNDLHPVWALGAGE